MNLHNKVIIITGSSDGIGKAIALRLAESGTRLALIARNPEKLEAVKVECLEKWALQVEAYPCDLRDTVLLRSTISEIVLDFWVIDILINNAWIWQKLAQLDAIGEDTIDAVIGANLTGLIHTTHAVLPHLRKRDEAIILNIVSKSWVTAQEWQSVYTASKYGVRGFTEVLQKDLKGSPVRVAGIYQAGTATQMFEKTDEDFPIEKFTLPSDLADVVSSMLSCPPKIWLHDVRIEY